MVKGNARLFSSQEFLVIFVRDRGFQGGNIGFDDFRMKATVGWGVGRQVRMRSQRWFLIRICFQFFPIASMGQSEQKENMSENRCG